MRTIYDDGREYDIVAPSHAGREELNFYAAQAALGSSSLELACGTGRLTVPLAERGLPITGLDNAPSMLAAAEAKANQHGVSPTFLSADICDFALNLHFDLIFLPNNSLGHLHSLPDLLSSFSCIRQHLSDTGRFVVDMFSPSLPLLMRDPGRHYPITTYTRPDGKTVTVTETVRYDPATQINHSLWHYQADGEPAEIRPLDLRIFFPQELDALLTLAGFAIEAKYGGFDLSPFTGTSRQQIIVCRKNPE